MLLPRCWFPDKSIDLCILDAMNPQQGKELLVRGGDGTSGLLDLNRGLDSSALMLCYSPLQAGDTSR
ncbi:hypothetical protein PG994_008040 [Apiospora phragmitis]|uniref:Uncharacterized protein n=1 Tax=Apiospora phragmitis TaxID=2905665 RepID=A0ABR1URX6_9PEZI